MPKGGIISRGQKKWAPPLDSAYSNWSTMARGICGADSSFRVGWRTAGGRGGGLVSVQDFSASIDKAFSLAGGLGTSLSFYGV